VADFTRIQQRRAIREAEGYLELSIGFSEQLSLRAELRLRLADQALQALTRVPASGNHRAHVLYLTGQAYRTMARYAEAVVPLAAAADLAPENIPIRLALAWCYKRVDRLDLAIQSLERAMAVDDQQAILHYNLACYWSLAGDAEVAIRYLAQSFDIEPSYRDLAADETDFDPIRNLPEFQALTGAAV